MKVLPPENENQKPSSTYKGNLPSQKYFTPKELNNLANFGKKPLGTDSL
jgi:hypothetical protein